MNKRLLHKIRYIVTAPLRYRTKRGFGVHSPFAFKYLMDVWSEKYHYYCYDVITDKYRQLIFRTINYLQPTSILMHGIDSETEKAIRIAMPQAIITENIRTEAECYVIQDTMPNISFSKKTADKANFAVIHLFPKDDCELLNNREYGMSFGNDKIRIYIMLRKLPPQDFNVWL